MGLVILDRSGRHGVSDSLFSGAGGLVVLLPLVGRWTVRHRARRTASPVPLPSWQQLIVLYLGVLLLFSLLLLVTA